MSYDDDQDDIVEMGREIARLEAKVATLEAENKKLEAAAANLALIPEHGLDVEYWENDEGDVLWAVHRHGKRNFSAPTLDEALDKFRETLEDE